MKKNRAITSDTKAAQLPKSSVSNIKKQIFREAKSMLRYALENGMEVPGDLVQELDLYDEDNNPGSLATNRLTMIHNSLAKIVSPATPGSLRFIDDKSTGGFLDMFGTIPLVRNMMAFALVSLVSFVTLAQSEYVRSDSGDIFSSNGFPLLINLMFFLSAAGLGASFSALFDASRFVSKGTFDHKKEPDYWIKFILGLISGMILPLLIPLPEGQHIAKPTLALMGGFSATAVYRILRSIITAVESIVKNDMRDRLEVQKQVAQMELTAQLNRTRLSIATSLMELEQTLKNKDIDSGLKELKQLLNRVIPRQGEYTPPDNSSKS